MKTLLSQSGKANSRPSMSSVAQRKGLHTMIRSSPREAQHSLILKAQRRSLYIREEHALDLLRKYGINASEYSGHGRRRLLAIAVDRSNSAPCIIASPGVN